MKTHNIYLYLLLAGWSLLAASCYDDKSTLQTTDIPTVAIEVPEELTGDLSVVHNARLDVAGFRIVKDGVVNPSELTYEWTASKTENESEPISLATTREFHEVIDLPIYPTGYLLVLTVTDPEYDLRYQHKWKLYVTAQYNEGIVVAYTKDGTTSDLGLIMHPQLTEQYSGAAAGTVEKDLIKENNGSALPSPVTHMLYTYAKSSLQNMLWVATENDLMRIETDYYGIMSHKEDVFVYQPERLKIDKLLNTYQCTLIVNDGDIYETLLSRDRVSTPLSTTSGMTIDNNVISAHSAPGYTRKPSTIFYDKAQSKFCYGYNTAFHACSSIASGAFNPGSLPGMSAVAGGMSVDATTHTLLMFDENESKYRLYTFGNVSSEIDPTPKLVYDIPSEADAHIRDAVSVFFSLREPVLYIADPTGIYKLIFEPGAVAFDSKPVFEAPAGEHVTQAGLYLQGYFAMENYESNAKLAWSSRAVVVVTSKDDMNDKIHVVPQINFGSGQLDQPNALVFDGFGKILDYTVAGLYK